ncbi:MAG: hypothetical protein E5V60_17765, partial [Mesorhizobium sp.]
DLIIGEGPAARSVKIDLARFTLVAATTRLGLLTNPLRDRFGIPVRLNFYTVEELEQIVRRGARILSMPLGDDGALEIARRSDEQHMVERLAASLGGVDEDLEIGPDRRLADELVERLRPQALVGILAALVGSNEAVVHKSILVLAGGIAKGISLTHFDGHSRRLP